MNDLRAFALRSVATKGSSLVIAVVVVSSSPDLAIASSASALLGAKDARRLDGFLGLKVFDPGCRRRTTVDGSVRHQPSVWSLSDHLNSGEQGFLGNGAHLQSCRSAARPRHLARFCGECGVLFSFSLNPPLPLLLTSLVGSSTGQMSSSGTYGISRSKQTLSRKLAGIFLHVIDIEMPSQNFEVV